MRWPAPTERPWALHGKRKRHFSEFSSGAARGDCGEYRQQQHHHTESRQAADRQRRQRVSTESSVFFFFWGGVRRPVALVAGLRRKNPAHRRKPATAELQSRQYLV